ncbi:saccharopine dehydrogenase family protein [Actinomadura rudentiformis]|uniref:NAD(P)H-binding protein n=1 Tax=Actinomadura rudentiformis TaxID=359158 RepID=A0A6H9Y9B2_9ACTN|nr:saccharopine dehydrogenase NADP-binding domain-containing protein [Actinomadura rudentiformis]KAB2340985.1 NAD(P)H-binding protein [Actinomadura rudentiformis]
MKIAVYGASGFTGGLTAHELRRRGLAPVVVGRDEERLRRVAAEVDADEVRVAGVEDVNALAAAFKGCDVVVNCAGPFTLWGEPVVRAAIAAGAHYVDTAGEQHYVHHILTTFREESGITIVPAMADDGGPGDLIARLTAERLAATPADLLIADLRRLGAASRGTARSMAAVATLDPLEFSDGDWRPVKAGAPSTIAVPGEQGEVTVGSFALPGVAMAPRHIKAGRVRSALREEVVELFLSLSAGVAESVPEIPDAEQRASDRWLMLAQATDEQGRQAQGWVTGLDPYRLTAVIAVEGARRLAEGGAPSGARTPAEAFDPTGFLNFLEPFGVTWQVK